MQYIMHLQWNSVLWTTLKVAFYGIADACLQSPKCIYICLHTTKMWKYLYSIKWTAPPVPTVLELYKIHSIIRMLISHFHKIVCHIQWIHTPGIIPALVQYVKNPNLWWNIPCEWTQVRRWKVLSRTITRYNICVRTKRRVVPLSNQHKKPLGAS